MVEVDVWCGEQAPDVGDGYRICGIAGVRSQRGLRIVAFSETDRIHGGTIYFGLGFGGFSIPVVSYAPLPILNIGVSEVTILIYDCWSISKNSFLVVMIAMLHTRSQVVSWLVDFFFESARGCVTHEIIWCEGELLPEETRAVRSFLVCWQWLAVTNWCLWASSCSGAAWMNSEL